MNPDQTYSVDSNAWVARGQIVFSSPFGRETSLAGSPVNWGGVFMLRSSIPLQDTMLASENALAKDWDSPEEDTAWANL
jgi:hypothetical protein